MRAGPRRRLCAKAADDAQWWVQRNWKSLAFTSLIGAWAYSLWAQNRSRRQLDHARETLKKNLPVNFDEVLELRAMNDVEPLKLASFTSVLNKDDRHSPSVLLRALSDVLGKPVSEAYAIERMLASLSSTPSISDDKPSTSMNDAPIGVQNAAVAIAFLSNGSVRERLEALFSLLCRFTSSSTLATDTVIDVVDSFVASGQIPVEKVVQSEQLGKGAIGIERSWYTIEPARQLTGANLLQAAQEEVFLGNVDGSKSEVTARGKEGTNEMDLESFISLLVSDAVCVWGECHNIAERKRKERQKEEADEYARNPPKWQFWKWGRNSESDS